MIDPTYMHVASFELTKDVVLPLKTNPEGAHPHDAVMEGRVGCWAQAPLRPQDCALNRARCRRCRPLPAGLDPASVRAEFDSRCAATAGLKDVRGRMANMPDYKKDARDVAEAVARVVGKRGAAKAAADDDEDDDIEIDVNAAGGNDAAKVKCPVSRKLLENPVRGCVPQTTRWRGVAAGPPQPVGGATPLLLKMTRAHTSLLPLLQRRLPARVLARCD